ncbi:Major facilitator superfamily [Patulibacter medicamentivorans]|uniref:Major facilitator superfamily n=1 Tax=Patulibacter medicamentivorans TaxID=1097667 RepID=H0EC58_9ACTN|nr:MFS transporter [Patulibacter medicamentivorans]EHN08730.1 Major facilitator superfamily [Patulibacter medicamentivorans]
MPRSSAPSTAGARRTLGPRTAYLLMAAVIGLALFASATPSPLYEVYREQWHFSPFVLTLVYAVYAFGVLTTLLLVGRISDEVGRRPVLLAAITTLLVATGLFAVADSLGVLFVARGLQGLATGAALGAASAALLDLHPQRDAHGAGLANGVASSGGLGLGAFVASLLVQYGPAPQRTPYLLLLALFAIVLAGVSAMPEPVAERRRLRLRPQAPRVPQAIRRPFLLAGLGVLSSWSIGGLFLSLGPELSGQLLDTRSHLAGGVATFALAGSGALSQLVFHRVAPWRSTSVGSLALAGGMALIVLSLSAQSAVLFLAATAITGMGFGVAFLGGLRSLTAVVPDHHRAEVMSAFYVVAYASLSLPALAAGLVVDSLGLEPTFRIFGALVVVVALVVAAEAWRTRPATAGRRVEAAHERPAAAGDPA